MALSGIIGRMRLAGEYDLHVAARRRQNPDQPFGIAENQLGPLVGGEPAGESDRQRPWIEQRTGSHDRRRADVLLRPSIARALTDEGKEKSLQRKAGVPQLVVGNGQHAIPERWVVAAIAPVRSDVP